MVDGLRAALISKVFNLGGADGEALIPDAGGHRRRLIDALVAPQSGPGSARFGRPVLLG